MPPLPNPPRVRGRERKSRLLAPRSLHCALCSFPRAREGEEKRRAPFCSFPRVRGKAGMGARRRRGEGATTGRQDAAADAVVAGMVRGSGMPPPQPSPARGGGSKKVALPCSALFALRSVLFAPRAREGEEKRGAPFCSFPRVRGKAGTGARRRRGEGATTGRQDAAADAVVAGMVRGSGMPPLHPSPARGGGRKEGTPPCSTLFALRSVLLPPHAGEGRDGARRRRGEGATTGRQDAAVDAVVAGMVRGSGMPPPQPSPARGGGRRKATRTFLLLPPRAG